MINSVDFYAYISLHLIVSYSIIFLNQTDYLIHIAVFKREVALEGKITCSKVQVKNKLSDTKKLEVR